LPLLNKSGASVARALRENLADSGYRKLQTDKGREFRNTRVEEFLKEENIRWFSSENETIKAALVERFNRTLRRRIHAYLTRVRHGRYIDRLADMVEAYNRTVHGATGVAPNDVSSENAADIFVRLYEPGGEDAYVSRKINLSVGDHVRTTKYRGAFERGYTEQWTREIFIITSVRSWERPVVYTLEDLAGESVTGTYYGAELQRVKKPDSFVVEKVLRSRGRGARAERLVKWLGYPDSFNSWVLASDFV
jgi:hypothetical protein